MRKNFFLLILLFLIFITFSSTNNEINSSAAADKVSDSNEEISEFQKIVELLYPISTWGQKRDDLYVTSLVDHLFYNTDSQFAVLFLDKLSELITDENTHLFQRLTTIPLNSFEGWLRDKFMHFLLNFYDKTGDNENFSIIINKMTLPPNVWIAGPLKQRWDYLLPVEGGYLLNSAYVFISDFGSQTWQKFTSHYDADYFSKEYFAGMLDKINNNPKFKGSQHQLFLTGFSVDVKDNFDGYLSIPDFGFYEMRINGKPAYQITSNEQEPSVEKFESENILLPIKFTKGRYDFIFQSENLFSGFYAQFYDVDGSTPSELVFSEQPDSSYGIWKPIIEKPIIGNIFTPTSFLKKYPLRQTNNKILELIIKLVQQNSDNEFAQFLKCQAIYKYLSNYEGWKIIEKLHSKFKNPIFCYFYAKFAAYTSDLPINYFQQKTLPELKRLENDFPNFLLPALDLADYELNAGRAKNALEIVNNILKKYPDNYHAKYFRTSLYELIDMSAIAETERRDMFFKEPNNPKLIKLFVKYYIAKQNHKKALELVEKLSQIIPNKVELIIQKMKLREKLNESFDSLNNSWLELKKTYLTNKTINHEHLKFLEAHRKYRDVLNVFLETYNKKPTPKMAKKIGELYLLLDEKELAIKFLEEAIKYDFANMKLRSYLAYIKGYDEYDFYKKYSISAQRALETKISPKDYPRQMSVVLLDEEIRKVYEDGTTVSVVTSIRKILTKEGVEKYGSVDIAGDLLDAKVIKADGKIVEPSFVEKKLKLPGTEIGCVQIIRFRVIQRFTPNYYLGDEFYFSDPGRTEYYLNSRLVLIINKNIDLAPTSHKIDIKETYKENDNKVYIFEYYASSPADYVEDYEPEFSEFLPHIELKNTVKDLRAPQYYFLEEDTPQLITSTLLNKAKSLTKNAKMIVHKCKILYNYAKTIRPDDALSTTSTILTGRGEPSYLFKDLLIAANIEFHHVYCIEHSSLLFNSAMRSINAWDNIRFNSQLIRIKTEDSYIFQYISNSKLKFIPFGYIPSKFKGQLGIIGGFAPELIVIEEKPTHGKQYTYSELNIDFTEPKSLQKCIYELPFEIGIGKKYDIQQIPLQNKIQWAAKAILDVSSNFVIHNVDFVNLTEPEKPLKVEYSGTISGLTQKIDKTHTQISNCLKRLELVKKLTPYNSRQNKMILDTYDYNVQKVRIKLDNSWIISDLPTSAIFFTKYFIYILNVEILSNEIVLTRTVHTFPAVCEVEEYKELQRVCKIIDETEQKPITVIIN